MNAKYEMLIKFTISQNLDDFSALVDPHQLGEMCAREMCDILTDKQCAVCYDIEGAKIDIH